MTRFVQLTGDASAYGNFMAIRVAFEKFKRILGIHLCIKGLDALYMQLLDQLRDLVIIDPVPIALQLF